MSPKNDFITYNLTGSSESIALYDVDLSFHFVIADELFQFHSIFFRLYGGIFTSQILIILRESNSETFLSRGSD